MSNSPEQFQDNQENNVESVSASNEQLNKLRNSQEKSAELSPRDAEAQAERARQEALESAVSVEKGGAEKKRSKDQSTLHKRGPINKKIRDESYSRTMKHVQADMSSSERLFSKAIHNKAVEKTSDIVGNTVARPTAMLSGAFSAFIITLVIYAIAKTIGYPLSGFETILAFVIGWLAGLLFDLVRTPFSNNK